LLLTDCLLFLQYENEKENRRKERKDMIVGIGIDIIEIERIEKMIEGQPKFIERILTEKERRVACSLKGKRRSEFVAGRFAAKEAYSKALGTGIGKEVSFLHIEITNDERGKPVLLANTNHTIHLSISHSREFAVAQVILESPSS
jgi:holo-[acyl-carrier protein] synthase